MLMFHSSIDVLVQRHNWMRSLNVLKWNFSVSQQRPELLVAQTLDLSHRILCPCPWRQGPKKEVDLPASSMHCKILPSGWLLYTVLARWSRIVLKKQGANSRLFFFSQHGTNSRGKNRPSMRWRWGIYEVLNLLLWTYSIFTWKIRDLIESRIYIKKGHLRTDLIRK